MVYRRLLIKFTKETPTTIKRIKRKSLSIKLPKQITSSCWLPFKKTTVDNAFPYDFKIFNFKDIGYIFLITAVVIPILTDLIFKIAYLNFSAAPVYITSARVVIRFASILIGMIIIFNKRTLPSQMVRTGAIAFYFYYFITNIMDGILIQLIYAHVAVEFTHINQTAILLAFNIIAIGTSLVITYIVCPILIKKIITTLKTEWRSYLVGIPVLILFGIGLNFGSSALQNLISPTISDNQHFLDQGFRVWYIILLNAILVILVAPIIEETATRHGIFQLCGDKWVGFIASVLFFSEMHITNSNDWEHIVAYVGGAIALATTFAVFRYNLTASILVHSAMNTVVFVITVVQANHN